MLIHKREDLDMILYNRIKVILNPSTGNPIKIRFSIPEEEVISASDREIPCINLMYITKMIDKTAELPPVKMKRWNETLQKYEVFPRYASAYMFHYAISIYAEKSLDLENIQTQLTAYMPPNKGFIDTNDGKVFFYQIDEDFYNVAQDNKEERLQCLRTVYAIKCYWMPLLPGDVIDTVGAVEQVVIDMPDQNVQLLIECDNNSTENSPIPDADI